MAFVPKKHHAEPTSLPPAISFLGLRIERKTDILAGTAFILAIISASFQTLSFFRGADVSLYSPDQIVIYFDTYPNGDVVTRIAASMNYVNRGEPGYSGTIRRERVAFELKGAKYEQSWQAFERLDRKGTTLEFYRESDARPTPVPGSSAVSHSTVFAPQPVRCSNADRGCDPFRNFLTKPKFLSSLDNIQILTFNFSADIVGRSQPVTASCSVDINDGMVALIMMNQWYTASCWTE
jgi:hypothetical protein